MISHRGLFLLMPVACLTIAEYCPPGWQHWRASCYRFASRTNTWADARSACGDIGGRMLAPRSADENGFVASLARTVGLTWVWLGCTDVETEGDWKCDGQGEGADAEYRNWGPEEPNNSDGREHCAYMNIESEKWNDARCSFAPNHGPPAICIRRSKTHGQYCIFTDTSGRPLANYCLFDHVIVKIFTRSFSGCGVACSTEPGCRSFNVRDEAGKKVCELNNSTRYEDQEKFQEAGGFCLYSEP